MQIRYKPLPVAKRFPLTISRGTAAGSENLLLSVTHDGLVGYGEFAPFSLGGGYASDAAAARADLDEWTPALADLAPWEMQRIEAVVAERGGGRGTRCALDMALHDWLGKKAGLPVWHLLGGDPRRIVATSVTVGINPPEVVRERVPELLARTGARSLKIKLGSPEGLEADRAMFAVVRALTPPGVSLRVDANGGWDMEAARKMLRWLAAQGVAYVEQPLPLGQEADLPVLFRDRPLPLFADESCHTAQDVPALADRVDGINLKLMKAGGIREGLRLIHAARAHGLQVMMGCMSETSLAIAASASVSSYADHLDLDSHLNLLPDPFIGLGWFEGRVLPGEKPGLGVERRAA